MRADHKVRAPQVACHNLAFCTETVCALRGEAVFFVDNLYKNACGAMCLPTNILADQGPVAVAQELLANVGGRGRA